MSRRIRLGLGLTAAALLAVGFANLSCVARTPPPNGDDDSPYRLGLKSPRLVTPQWIGEPGVEAVVILSIDDMTDNLPKYEGFLRPILDRLKAIDGRAPVSILTCKINPAEPRLQSLLKEGVSYDVHTTEHPCPCLQKGNLDAAARTYHDSVDIASRIPGNRPAAFRMPCCDSMNSVSPRFFSEIFNRKSAAGNFLEIDSSVFTLLTPDDPALPRSSVLEADGKERFRKYVPTSRGFVNIIENYPYPYPIRRLCWEFPCIVPSDWEAQNLHRPNNPKTTEDLKAALDGVVAKQGVFTFVFHPHGWISAPMVVDFIDHAVATHGKKVKFLTFQEARDRLNRNLLSGGSLRKSDGSDAGYRLADLNGDGYFDLLSTAGEARFSSVWNPEKATWTRTALPEGVTPEAAIGTVAGRRVALARRGEKLAQAIHSDGGWREEKPFTAVDRPIRGQAAVRLLDIDGDGSDELIVSGPEVNLVAAWNAKAARWEPVRGLPEHASLVDTAGLDNGVRFADVDQDGALDVLVSNESREEIHLFDRLETGWSRAVPRPDSRQPSRWIPSFVRNGTEMGVWFADGELFVQNEDTSGKPAVVDRRSFARLIEGGETRGKNKKAALESIRVAPGFRVELMASEPLVADPIAFDWGADGTFYVVEMGDYPLGVDGKGKSGGKVRILRDKDGDGTFDTAVTFLDGLPFPTAVMPWRKGVLITAAPDLIHAEDTDGDGKADVRKVILTGFVPGNPQHRVNGFELGLDGWVYAANGDSGGVVKSPLTGKSVSISGRDFRFNPDTGEVEPESGQTQYGRSRDDWGRWYGNNNSVWGWQYVLNEHDLARNPAFRFTGSRQGLNVPTRVYPRSRTLPRFNVPAAANHVTSANSPTPYRDDLFGPAFSSAMFVSEPVHNLVRRFDLLPDGVATRGEIPKGEEGREFLASSDNWFRPTGMKTGPDGGLWIADMYRAVIEHPEWIPDDWEAKLDLRAGANEGRIYRVLPVGDAPRPFRPMDKLSTAELVAELESPNGRRRDTAQRLLMHANDRAALPLLEATIRGSARPKTRLQALAVWSLLGGNSPEVLLKALADTEPMVRRHAVRLATAVAPRDERVANALLAAASDPTPVVRFETALALGDWADPRAGKALASIATRDSADPWTRAAVLTSAKPHAAILLGEILAASGDRPPTALIEPLFASLRSDSGKESMDALRRSIFTPARGEAFADWQLAGAAGLADAARDASFLGDRARLVPMLAAARAIVGDDSAPESRRVLAARVISSLSIDPAEVIDALSPRLVPRTPPDLRRTVVAALGKLDSPKVPTKLLEGWKGHSPALRDQVLEVLLSRTAWTGALLSSLEDTCTPAADISGIHRDRMLNHADKSIKERSRVVFDASAPSTRQAVIDKYASALKRPGDAARGRAAFRKTCATCHKVGGEGGEVGPDLSTVGDKPAEALLVALLDPNRAFESRYASFAVALNDGRIFTGLIAGESANAVTLRKTDGKDETIPRSEIESIVGSGRSLMPEGLENDLKPEDVADLIAFLRSNESPPKTFAGNKPVPVGADADDNLILNASSAEIRGSTLVFEPTYGNLGYWSSSDDRAAWSIEPSKPGRYRVVLDYACPADAAGGRLVIAVGDRSIEWIVESTGSWDRYRSKTIGEIELGPEARRLDVRAGAKPNSALLDLRKIELRPVR